MKVNAFRKLTISVEKYKGTTETLKIYLHVENVGSLGVKTTKREGRQGAKFA